MNNLHSFVTWAAGAFGACPADIVERALPLAGLAVQAVGWISRLYDIMNRLIYTRRAECDTWTIKNRCALGFTDV